VDCLDEPAKASEFMAKLFSLNPLGVEFDPDEWLSKLRAGAEEREFLARQVHEPVSPLRGSFAEIVLER
jgi:hypothetical protein